MKNNLKRTAIHLQNKSLELSCDKLVTQKIRNSNCKKKNSSLEEFNWFINSCVEWLTTGSGRVFACLVAKTKGIGYYSDHFEIVPNYIIEYWKN